MRFNDFEAVRTYTLQLIIASALPPRAWLKDVGGGVFGGVSEIKDENGQKVLQHFVEVNLMPTAIQADEDTVTGIVAAHKTLPVQTDKATITADGVDTATITCNDPSFAGDTNLAYYVVVDNQDYASGDVPVIGGAITLTLATSVAGTYIIEVWRKTGNYAHGFILVTAE